MLPHLAEAVHRHVYDAGEEIGYWWGVIRMTGPADLGEVFGVPARLLFGQIRHHRTVAVDIVDAGVKLAGREVWLSFDFNYEVGIDNLYVFLVRGEVIPRTWGRPVMAVEVSPS